jgi:hypothetical protein
MSAAAMLRALRRVEDRVRARDEAGREATLA